MHKFIVRVELHGADWTTYERLHAAMHSQQFLRIIVADDGSRHALPTAEYISIIANETVEQVRDRVVAVASTVSAKPSVLVIEAGGVAWANLPPG